MDRSIDFALLTALEVERKAVCLAFGLGDEHRVKIGARVYWRGTLAFDDGARYELVVGQSPDMANIDMALLANDTLHDWHPRAVILVGIAGATGSEVAVGDVVIGSEVYYYERGKHTSTGVKHEPKIIAAHPDLWGHVIALPDWDGRIGRTRPDGTTTTPRVHKGVIASGEKVIADHAIRDDIASGHRKMVAIEMEGYGCGRAVWQSARRVSQLVIRGIADAANASKNDDWHAYAAAAAAAFAKHFLADRPLPPRSTVGDERAQGGPDGSPESRQGLVESSGWRYACHRHFPRFYGWLHRAGLVRTPVEHAELAAFMREHKAAILNDIASKTYVPVHARTVPRVEHAEHEGDDLFVRPIHQVIRVILGRSEGGDSASAELAVLNRQSRVVRNVTRTLRRASDPLILLGDPGVGKSMTLQQVACMLINDELRRAYPALTLYIPLGEFHKVGPVAPSDVLAYVRSTLPRSLQERLGPLDEAGRLILLFDGMDEMSRERYNEHTEALSQFAFARHRNTKTLFSCRITDFSPAFKHRRLVLVPFDRSQILRYLRAFFGARDAVIEIAGDQWSLPRLAKTVARRELSIDATNPFVLWLLCHHLAGAHRWPGSRVELLEHFLEQTFRRKQSEDPSLVALNKDDCMRAFAEYAFIITERNLGRAIPVAELVKRVGASPYEVERMIRVGHSLGVLAESKDRHEYQVRFDHHRLQEHFTARHLRDANPDIQWLDKLDVPRWQETLVNTVLLGKGQQAIGVLAGALDETLDALNKVRGEYEQREKRGPDQKSRLSPGEEIRFADRVELAARLVNDGSTIPDAKELLLPALRRSVDYLTSEGNPITQVKMMRACIPHMADSELNTAARRPMASKVEWVRTQALILLTAGERGIGVNLANEIGSDLARGKLLAQMPFYLRVVARARQPGAARSFAVGIVSALLLIVLYIVTAMAVYWSFHRLGVPEALGQFTHRRANAVSFGAIMTLVIGASLLLRTQRYLGAIAIAATLILFATECFGSFVEWTAVVVFVLMLWPQLFLLHLALSFMGLSFFWIFARPPLAHNNGSNFRSVIRLIAPQDYDLLTGILFLQLGSLFMSCLVVIINSRKLELQLSNPYILYVVGVVSLLLSVAVITRGTDEKHEQIPERGSGRSTTPEPPSTKPKESIYKLTLEGLLIFAGVLIGLAFAFALAIGAAWLLRAAFRALSDVGDRNILEGVRVVIIIAVIGTIIGVLVLRWLYLLFRPRIYRPRSFTADGWIKRIESLPPARQARMIARTNALSLGITTQQFLDVLDSIASKIRSEPALSAYWEHRNELEKIVRQDRRG